MKVAAKKINGKKIKAAADIDPERRIAGLAKRGFIRSAGQDAIAASFKRGLSVTVLENGVIYRLHPDGKRTIVKRHFPNRKKYPSGKMLIL
jgi:hypothetical protein